jgi:hypothetical protein
VVAPNPAFFDRSLPAGAAQVITVEVACRKIGDAAVGPGCGDGTQSRVKDYVRLLTHLDWNALRQLTIGG